MSFDLPALPDRWKYTPLEQLAQKNSVTYGVVQPGAALTDGVPIVRVNNFKDGHIEMADLMRIAPEIEAKYNRTRLQGGEVLLTVVGSVGQVAVVPPSLRGFNVARAVAVIHPVSTIEPEWIAFCLRSPLSQHLLASRANTTVQTTINLKDLRALPIPLPPAVERKKIAAILGAIEDRITLLREGNATLEAIAQALFKSWFVDFDPVRAKREGRVPDGMDERTAALFPNGFEGAELGLVPTGWRLTTLAGAYEINPKRTLRKGAPAPYVDMASVSTVGHSVESVVPRAMGSGSKFQNGDSLLARITPCLENGKSAFVDFLESDQVGWGSTEFVVLRPRPPLPSFHGYLLCRHSAFREFAIQSMSGTSGRQRVANDVLARYIIACPSEAVANAFAEIVEPLQAKITGNHTQLTVLADMRDTLLPRLISGRLRLSEAEALVA
ncbi:Type I restriction modification DNA specificity domain protein [Caballeronia sp. SBC1]|uniref:restriction endonuclease subunit S n=1 Tax=Caballeronia sp. SBC1 TaxID=2705548 RepID=UPI00140A31F8|nr:restriction endonuclease subunit S [Caballeronia sp. SBC1]QIN62658.1 Type I restriction modification DNA specificity domain protein [Caballeronia sp. SBC1]